MCYLVMIGANLSFNEMKSHEKKGIFIHKLDEFRTKMPLCFYNLPNNTSIGVLIDHVDRCSCSIYYYDDFQNIKDKKRFWDEYGDDYEEWEIQKEYDRRSDPAFQQSVREPEIIAKEILRNILRETAFVSVFCMDLHEYDDFPEIPFIHTVYLKSDCLEKHITEWLPTHTIVRIER